MADPPYPDVEVALVAGLKDVTPNTGTPHPNLQVVPPFIRVQRVPGGPGSTPWQDRPQVELIHYGATRAEAWDLARRTEEYLDRLNPAGGRVGGVFFDYARRVADAVQVVDDNPDLRPVVVVWRLAMRRQPAPVTT